MTRKVFLSIPSRGFWFFEVTYIDNEYKLRLIDYVFQSPRGDFGFLKLRRVGSGRKHRHAEVSIPSRGFWFFEVTLLVMIRTLLFFLCFNPLAGILVFEGVKL